MKTKNKQTVLITGITGDIGTAIALKFAKHGWNILGHYNASQTKLKALERRINLYGAEISFLKADFISQTQVTKFLKSVSKYRIDCLVNNAGSYVVQKHFSELSMSNLTKSFTLNVFSPILLTTKIFEQMKKNGFGRIINISSIATKYGGSEFSMHYGSAKMAMEGVMKTLAKAGAGHNILVNTVRPGVIDTQFHKKFSKNMDARIQLIPLKRMGQPQDVANMIYYLASEQNDYITNEIITVAGGEERHSDFHALWLPPQSLIPSFNETIGKGQIL